MSTGGPRSIGHDQASLWTSNAPLLPRYARLLTVAGILDEAVALFRRCWLPMMLTMAVVAVPEFFVNFLSSRVLAPGANAADASLAQSTAGLGQSLAVLAVLVMLEAPAHGVVALLAERAMRGGLSHTTQEATADARLVPAAYRRILPRVPAAVGSVLLASLLVTLCALVAALLFILTLFGVLGVIISAIMLLVWWRNPGARRSGLRRAIVMLFPFGLPVYYFVLWSLAVPAVVFEGRSATGALSRSAELVRGSWFRVLAVWGVITLTVSTLLATLPFYVVSTVIYFVEESLSAWGTPLGTGAQALASAASSLGNVLFGAVPYVGTTLLFFDLRNRWEGADLAERLAALSSRDAAPPDGSQTPLPVSTGTVSQAVR